MNRFYVQCPPGFKARNPDVFDWADRTKNSLKLNIKAGKWYLGFDNQQDLQYFVDKWLTPLSVARAIVEAQKYIGDESQ